MSYWFLEKHTYLENSDCLQGGSVYSIQQSMISATSQKDVCTSYSAIIAKMFMFKDSAGVQNMYN